MRTRTDSSERLAESIVGVLSVMALRVECAIERGNICYAIRSRRLKLRSIVLSRSALRRLLTATNGLVKIEYLKRDLLQMATQRAEYCYPRRSSQAA